MKSMFACFCLAGALLANISLNASTPNVENVKSLEKGALLCELNVKEKSKDWEDFQNYGHRLVWAFETIDNTPVMTIRNAARKRHDTAWLLLSKAIKLDASVKNLIVEIDFRADLIWNVPNNPKTPFRNCVIWYNSSNKKIKHTDITYAGYPNKFTLSTIPVEVPAGAVSCRVNFGTDHPNITDDQLIAYRSVKVFAAK